MTGMVLHAWTKTGAFLGFWWPSGNKPEARVTPGKENMINKTAFIVIAGAPGAWDAETQSRTAQGEYLPDIQEDQRSRGKLEAEILRSIYGWYVRSGSGLDNFGIMYIPIQDVADKGFAEAMDWGNKWAEEDPQAREFYARRSELFKHPLETAFFLQIWDIANAKID